eukprot:scaffold4655_cov115-Isochrysis_galbana.AAC.6
MQRQRGEPSCPPAPRTLRYAPGSAALVGLLRCASFDLRGQVTVLPGTMTRGDMATVVVAVREPAGYRFKQSGFPRPAGAGLQPAAQDAQGRDNEPRQVAADMRSPQRDRMAIEQADEAPGSRASAAKDNLAEEFYRFTLIKERRPPLDGCWLVREVLPMRHHMLFAGDSGGC